MDHPLRPAATLPPHVWRSAAVIATLVAVVELALLIGAGVALLTNGEGSTSGRHKTAAASPKSTRAVPQRRPARTVAPAKLTRGHVRVMVLNGNGRQGAASSAATRVRHHGYRIGTVGNAGRMSYARSLVMYRPGYEGEGRRLARDLGIRLVGPLDGMRPAQLHGAQAVLIIGR